MITVIYNPGSFEEEYSTLTINHSQANVQHWDKHKKTFVDVDAEAFCYTGPNNVNECELNIMYAIPPLSFEIFRVKYQESMDLSVSLGANFDYVSIMSTQQQQ